MEESGRFIIRLLALPADQPDVLRNLKVFLLTEMGLSVDEAQGLLYSLPKEIYSSDSQEEITSLTERLKQFGADFEVCDSEAEIVKDISLAPTNSQTTGEQTPQESLPEDSAQNNDQFSSEKNTVPASLVVPEVSQAPQSAVNTPQLKISTETAQDESNYQIHRPTKLAEKIPDENVLTRKTLLINSLMGIGLAAIISIISYHLIIAGDESLLRESFSSEQVEQLLRSSEDIPIAEDNSVYKHKFEFTSRTEDLKIQLTAKFFDSRLKEIDLNLFPLVKFQTNDPVALPPLKIEKIVGESFNYRSREDGYFLVKGKSKIFLSDANSKIRLPADTVLSGKFNNQSQTVKLRILINRGFRESPGKTVIDINQREVNNSRLYLDIPLEISKNSYVAEAEATEESASDSEGANSSDSNPAEQSADIPQKETTEIAAPGIDATKDKEVEESAEQ